MTLNDKLQERIKRGKVHEFSQFGGFRDRTKQMIKTEVEAFKREALQELQHILKEAIGEEGALALRGERGYTPQKGTDYFTHGELETIKREIMPIKGRHYRDGRDGRDGKDVPIDMVKSMISKMMPKFEQFDVTKQAELIARAIEKLDGEKRLDFDALRNRPVARMWGDQSGRKYGVNTLIRGGGDTVNIKDLSSSTDGTTKTFTVPYHSKAFKVEMSDFPHHLYEGNGFTVASNKLSITLTVPNAPSSGSQLAFLYTS